MKLPNEFFEDEIRDGFYVSSIMKRNWAAQLELLEEIGKVCKEHNLRWFAEFGTMIGAVRHKGFVPWDDDVDISMPREDYMELVDLAKKGKLKDITLNSMHDKKLKDNCFASLFEDLHEIPVYEGELCEKFHYFPLVAGIDVFPLDYVDPDAEEESTIKSIAGGIRTVAALIDEETGEIRIEDPQLLKDAKELLTRLGKKSGHTFIYDASLKRQVLMETEKLIASTVKNRIKSKRVAIREYQLFRDGFDHRKETYSETVMMPFECIEIPVPKGYDEILSHTYGDYMKVKRYGGHGYPYFTEQIDMLGDNNIIMNKYVFKPDQLELEKRDEWMTEAQKIRKIFGFIRILISEAENCVQSEKPDQLCAALADCQDLIVALGDIMEKPEAGMGEYVGKLEKICELLYHIYEKADSGNKEELGSGLKDVSDSVEEVYGKLPDNIRKKREIVFIPFKPGVWNALDPIWRAAKANKDWEVHVVPIPYYYRTPEGKMFDMQYKLEDYPAELEIEEFDKFGFADRHPDMIIMQSPYDSFNFSTTIHPDFYSYKIREYTEQLLYVPWFVTDDFNEEDTLSCQTLEYFCTMPGVTCSDHTIVQSENMKRMYIDRLAEFAGEDTRAIWEEKIRGTGSPLLETDPEVWKKELSELLGI